MHKRRRSSDAHLPPAPLDFAHPLAVRGAQSSDAVLLAAAPPEHALVLWRVYQRLAVWTGGPGAWAALGGAEAGRAFEEAVLRHDFGDAALWAPLGVIATQLRAPARADSAVLANACLSVADWALGRDAGAAALLFAELGAEAWPENPRVAWVAGKLMRARAAHREAALWFHRAARVAVWNEDWEAQALALNSLGNLYLKVGDYPEARRFLTGAYRVATRQRLRTLKAEILHDFVVLAVMTGDHRRAERHAADAFAAYPPRHPNLPRLAYDVSHLWMLQGHFARASRVFRALLPCFEDPERLVLTLGGAARTAGALGDGEAFEEYWRQAWAILDAGEADRVKPGVAEDLGFGALSLSRWTEAGHALETARAAAVQIGESDTLARVESALDHLRRYESAEAATAGYAGPRTITPAELLARDLVQVLEEGGWTPDDPESQPPYMLRTGLP